MIAGVVALEQRGTAREQATAAEAQRLGSRALVESSLDRAVLLARQAVVLDDTVQTRGNLRAALLKSPAAIGVLRGAGEGMSAVALSPDSARSPPATPPATCSSSTRRRADASPRIKPGNADSWIVQLAYSPDGSRLAIAHMTPERGNVVTVFDSDSRRVVARMTPPPRPVRHRPPVLARTARTLDAIAVTPRPGRSGPALLTRFDTRSGRRAARSRARQPPPLVAPAGSRATRAGW